MCVVACCSWFVAVCGRVLQCAAVHCSALQCAAVCCSVLQCAAECCCLLIFLCLTISDDWGVHILRTWQLETYRPNLRVPKQANKKKNNWSVWWPLEVHLFCLKLCLLADPLRLNALRCRAPHERRMVFGLVLLSIHGLVHGVDILLACHDSYLQGACSIHFITCHSLTSNVNLQNTAMVFCSGVCQEQELETCVEVVKR